MFNRLSCKLIAKRGKKAEIEIEGQNLTIPIDSLPASIDEGEIIELYFSTVKDAKMKEETLARLILEEILNGK